MVCPLSAASNWIVSPSAAAAIAARSEPVPLSAVLVTMSVAAWTLPRPAGVRQSRAIVAVTKMDKGPGNERIAESFLIDNRMIREAPNPKSQAKFQRTKTQSTGGVQSSAGSRVKIPRPWVAATNFGPIQNSSTTPVRAGVPVAGDQLAPPFEKTPISVPM